MGRRSLRLAVVTWLAASLTAGPPVTAQSPPTFATLSEAQQRLAAGLAPPPAVAGTSLGAEASFDGAEASFRATFATITMALAAVSLSDHENGEILGVALDLVGGVEPLARQPATGEVGAAQLLVTLAPGARDRLRRSSEFAPDSSPIAPGYSAVYLQKSSPSLQFALIAGSRALVSIPR